MPRSRLHSVHFIRRELELVTRERMRKTQTCGIDLGGLQIRHERRQMLPDSSVDITSARCIGDDLQGEARQLGNGVSELRVGHSQRGLGLVLEAVQKLAELG